LEIVKQSDIWYVEAQPDVAQEISKKFPNVIQACVSDESDKEVLFYVTNNSMSSSILKLKDHLIK